MITAATLKQQINTAAGRQEADLVLTNCRIVDVFGGKVINGNIAIADGIAFDTGFALKEFAKLAGIELKPGDINQEE